MANVQDVPSPNWTTYDMPSRSLNSPRMTESGAVGKLNGGSPVSCNCSSETAC